jgi:hypothetical protein
MALSVNQPDTSQRVGMISPFITRTVTGAQRHMAIAFWHLVAPIQGYPGQHGTFGAVQRLPKELPSRRSNIVILTRAGSLAAFEQDSTIIAVRSR